MKKNIFLIAALFVSASLPAQMTPDSLLGQQPVSVQTDYLKKSREQKTGAILLLGGGVGLMVASMATAASNTNGTLNLWGVSAPPSAEKKNAGVGLFIAGGVAAMGSIPLFIAAGKNKRRARLTASDQTTFVTPSFQVRQTTIGLAIPL